MVLFVSLLVLWTYTYAVEAELFDPCKDGLFKNLDEFKLGSRNEKCPTASPHNTVCDHYLKEDWYAVKDAVLLNRCPTNGGCGVIYQIWMKGDYPLENEGTVNRTACIHKFKDCCYETIDIEIKNCTNFLVYHLYPPATCPTAYCFDSGLPCVVTTTQGTTTTGANDSQEDACNSRCVLIIVSVVIGLLICITVVVVCVMYHYGIHCRKRRRSIVNVVKNASIDDQPPPYTPYEVNIPKK